MFVPSIFNNKLLIASTVVLGAIIIYKILNSSIATRRKPRKPSPEGMDEMMRSERDCLVPKVTDTFTLKEIIGCGSYSNVYRAVLKDTGLVIAVKSYKIKKNNTAAEISRAAVEMAFVRFLDHPNIIKFKICDIKSRYMYLGIEYSSFGSLQKVMPKDHNAPEKVVQTLMKQLLSALSYLHNLSIMHGDVKPENIIVTRIEPDIFIKLSDFGLAEIFFDAREKGKRIGSFLYMAPELHLGFPYDLSADLYSAGIVMYELLYGKRPFPTQVSRDEYVQLLRKRMIIQYPPIKNAQLSTNCLDLVKTLLQYDKQKRPSDDDVIKHPFICLEKQEWNTGNHYVMGCNCLLNSVQLAGEKKFGPAYVEATEAILHLKIYAKSILPDQGLFVYLTQNIKTYYRFLSQIEFRILIEKDHEPINMPMTSEKLRCMLSSTPALLTGYDMCIVGEMYTRQEKNEEGVRKLKDGLDVLFSNIQDEPVGDRRSRLLKKMKYWVNLLESLDVKVEEIGTEAKSS